MWALKTDDNSWIDGWQPCLGTSDRLLTRNFFILYHQTIIFEARKHPRAGILCLHIDSRSEFFFLHWNFFFPRSMNYRLFSKPRFPGLAMCSGIDRLPCSTLSNNISLILCRSRETCWYENLTQSTSSIHESLYEA